MRIFRNYFQLKKSETVILTVFKLRFLKNSIQPHSWSSRKKFFFFFLQNFVQNFLRLVFVYSDGDKKIVPTIMIEKRNRKSYDKRTQKLKFENDANRIEWYWICDNVGCYFGITSETFFFFYSLHSRLEPYSVSICMCRAFRVLFYLFIGFFKSFASYFFLWLPSNRNFAIVGWKRTNECLQWLFEHVFVSSSFPRKIDDDKHNVYIFRKVGGVVRWYCMVW